MSSKNNEIQKNEDREQFLYAQDRIRQKKRLNQHFVVFLIGSAFIIILDQLMGVGKNLPIENWYVWAILIWTFFFLIHAFNVFFTNRFMGKKWENEQLDKLKAKQQKRITELQKRVDKEMPLPNKPVPVKATKQAKNQTITLIAAASENDALGKDNDLVWHLPDDFKRFKKLTTGHHIIMGRKTFETFPEPLPNRIHVVITRDKTYKKFGAIVVHSINEALELAKQDDQPFIIGGGEIYKQSLEYADKIELTRVHSEFPADTFFPHIDESKWELINEEHHPKDDKHEFAFTYLTYIRK
ncbi:MAG: dihydrofolate reductase [Flavobacteriaceae bacterium]|nr:dihydrofolate reductase [Flavobacteriaceae bacterium]